jgi:hypothetical protein
MAIFDFSPPTKKFLQPPEKRVSIGRRRRAGIAGKVLQQQGALKLTNCTRTL